MKAGNRTAGVDERSRKRAVASAKSLLLAVLLLAAPGCGDGGGTKSGDAEKSVSGEDVRREVGEAIQTTKDYLSEGTEKLKSRFDEKMSQIDVGIEEMKKKSAAAGEKGRVYRDEALAGLRDKKEKAMEKMEDFKESSGELREDAARKLDESMKELEEAYDRAKKRFESDDQ